MTLFTFLAGMSFVLACLAVVIAVAEYRRADRVERPLVDAQVKHQQQIADLLRDMATVTRSNADLWRFIADRLRAQQQPEPAKPRFVGYLVPGPETRQ